MKIENPFRSTMGEHRVSDLNLLYLQRVQDIDIDQVVTSFIKKNHGDCLLHLFGLVEKNVGLYVSACI